MTREFLKQLGLSDEAIESIMAEHGKTITKLRDDITGLTAKAEEAKELKEQLESRDTQLTELKEKAKDNEDLIAQITALEEQNKTTAAEYEDKIAAINKKIAIEKAIGNSDLNFHNAEVVMPLIKQDAISINDEGITGLKEQLESLAESNPFLCKQKEDEKKPGIPSIVTKKGNSGDEAMTMEDLLSMSTVERTKFKQENEQTYNELMKK